MAIGFISIEIFNDFCNIETRERDLFVYLRATVENLHLFLSECTIIKDLSFLLQMCNIIVVVINWWDTSYYLF